MQYRDDPKSGNKLSILGFGCMRFPRDLNAKINADKVEKLIGTAIENGVNYFDTAYSYSGNEDALGEALTRLGHRDKIHIATKFPHQQCETFDDFDRIFAEQLTRLRTNHIDYYLVHNLSSPAAWKRIRSLGFESWVAAKKASGDIGQIGYSFHGAQKDFLDLLDLYNWDFCQIQYNYMDENYQAGRAGLLKAHELGLPVIVMEPLRGGKLATALPKQAAQILKKADNNRSAAAWALQWIWNQPEVTVTLSGMNSLEQIADNVATANNAKAGMFSQEDIATILVVVDELRSAYKIPCTGCDYCMPCPQGVNIPSCFAAYNTRYVTGLVSGLSLYEVLRMSRRSGKNMTANSCVKCGACEKKCPQHIPIMQELEAVKRALEPFWLKSLLKIYWKIMN